ncbi:MAG TPA: nuclear transport factor 2 family protein [Sphingomicrobium sp.]|nr:nuclear transport factor 2 family protein [Sphingomicrobium sp.]
MPLLAIAAAALISAPAPVETMTPLQRETAMWDMVKDKRMDAFAAMLMPSFVGIGSHGVVDRTEEIDGVRQGHLLSYKLSDVRIDRVDANDVLLTYVADLMGEEAGRPAPVRIQVATLGNYIHDSLSL